jgi:indole-3-glycerol phosphate synthase/phosphoribosylanthranilate isomerase/anthranilate synthase/indole-3-glycerol phosphate synthase/phosphoribosylanthranilate isomerase
MSNTSVTVRLDRLKTMSETGSETFLERIVGATRAELAARQAREPLDAVCERAIAAPPPRDFAAALRPESRGPARLVAEVKRASPSKGLLAATFDPVAQAQAYQLGGAAAISVLTEPRFFLGALDHLTAVRAAVELPVLRKDFVLDPYQVYEARAAGADAVLLICALLDDATLAALVALTRELGMEALVETHDAAEARGAVASDARVIGVNSRDLRTFAVDTDVVRHLRPLVPDDRIFVAESGIADARGAARACAWGADAILVGEALMRATDPAAKARELCSAAGGATASFFAGSGRPFLKICGLTTAEQVRAVAQLGADAFGLVFAPMAPDHRRITPEKAATLVRAASLFQQPVGTSVRTRQAAPTQALAPSAPKPTRGSPFPAGTEGGQGVRTRPLAVGVFVNQSPSAIHEIAERVGLDAIQLSGDETPEECAEVAWLAHKPVIKALRPRMRDDLALLDAYALARATILLDTPKDDAYGGTGQTGDWALARAAAERWPMILSGGLTPDNVVDAIAAVAPRGVDVSSGVESVFASSPAADSPFPTCGEGDQGVRAKDPAKIARFIAAARDPAHAAYLPKLRATSPARP